MSRKVVMYGAEWPYEEKGKFGFVPSGKSILGAFELHEDGVGLKCHECGDHFGHLGRHVKIHFGMTAREYKKRHGLPLNTSLSSPRAREDMAKHPAIREARLALRATAFRPRNKPVGNGRYVRADGSIRAALRNLRLSCPEQLRQQLKQAAAELGHTPVDRELRARGINPTKLAERLGVKGIDEAMEVCGLVPNRDRENERLAERYSITILIELLRDARIKLRRIPRGLDCGAPLLPSRVTFVRHFGSWQAALDAAGFGLISRQKAS